MRFPAGGRAWIPVDDNRTMTFYISYHHPDRPLTDQDLVRYAAQVARFLPELIPGTFLPKRNMENDYLLDREIQRTVRAYTGIWGVNDRRTVRYRKAWAPSTTAARSTSARATLAIITARRRLMNLARDLQQGIEPFPASHGDLYRVRAMDVNTALDDFDAMRRPAMGEACAPRCRVAVGWALKRVGRCPADLCLTVSKPTNLAQVWTMQ